MTRRGRGDFAALFVGVGGASLLAGATPYNNFVVGNVLVADSYLPLAALAPFLLLLAACGLARWALGRVVFDRSRLALILAAWMIACVPLSSGFLRAIPYAPALTSLRVSLEKHLADRFPRDEIPAALFPDPLVFGGEAPAASAFQTQLPPGRPIPWAAWARPAVAWGSLALFWWAMMLGLAAIAYPQWRDRERVEFPLLRAYRALLPDSGEPGAARASVARSRAFWIAAVAVFAIRLLDGFHQLDEQSVPALILNWDLSEPLSAEPFAYLPAYIKTGRISFVFIAAGFLMSSRAAISIWFCALAYALYVMLGQAYAAPFHLAVVNDHRTGALLAYAAAILWIGRAQWRRAARALAGGGKRPTEAGADAERTARVAPAAAWLFVGGWIGVAAWLMWAGAGAFWAIFLAGAAFLYALVAARLLAETGLPVIGVPTHHLHDVLRLFPVAWFRAGAAFLGGAMAALLGMASRIGLAGVAMHAIGLLEAESPDRDAPADQGAAPAYRSGRLLLAALLLLILATGVGGAAHLVGGYRHASTLDGQTQPLNLSGSLAFEPGWQLLAERSAGAWNRPTHAQLGAIAFGAALTGLLQALCWFWPRWPLHPIGMVLLFTSYLHLAWPSVFVGWLLRGLLLRYGGARRYESALPVVIGMFLGEVAGAAFWAAIPLAAAALGRTYEVVSILPG